MENTELLADCRARIARAMNMLSVQQPALMIYMGLVEFVPVYNPRVTMRLATRRVGDSAYMEYNPKFVAALDEDSVLAFVLYIEGMRLALHHCTQRLLQPYNFHKLASDLICADNRAVLNSGRDVVKNILSSLPDFIAVEKELRPLGFKRETDFSLERLVAYFRKKMAEEAKKVEEEAKEEEHAAAGAANKPDNEPAEGDSEDQETTDGGASEGQESDADGESSGEPIEGEETDEDAEGEEIDEDLPDLNGSPADGEGSSAGGSSPDDQKGTQGDNSTEGQGTTSGDGASGEPSEGSEHDFSMGDESDDYGSMGDALDRHFDSNNRELTAEWGENTAVDNNIRRATEILRNTPELWGKCSEGLRAMILQANEIKFDPKRVVERFKAMLQSQNTYQSRSKYNKKNPDFCGWRHEMETKLLELIDSSGSMSDKSVSVGEAFINLFIKRAHVDYAFWDTAMYDIMPRGKKKISMKEPIEVQGRGGTDPSCIIKKLNTLKGSKYKYGGLIVFTDCGFDWPDPGPKWRNKILIISTTSKENAPDWARCRNRVIALSDIIEWNERNDY